MPLLSQIDSKRTYRSHCRTIICNPLESPRIVKVSEDWIDKCLVIFLIGEDRKMPKVPDKQV
jgi:hypothetical protein